jgi:CRISPR-associated protein Cas1
MAHVSDAPDYLPARMLNEYVYCPRLFYYMWVESIFAHNRETTEGALRHSKIDAREDSLAPAGELSAEDRLHSRSVTLSSDAHGLIAKMDLIEVADNAVTPVDYKRGAPPKNKDTGELETWDTDRVQLGVQALVLRDNGYTCEEGVVYHVATKQRVRVAIDEALVAETLQALADARVTAAAAQIPPPLVDSPKCPRCSLVGICLPDETRSCRVAEDVAKEGTLSQPPTPGDGKVLRRLVPARDDLRPLYLNAQGLYVGKSGNVLKVKEKAKVVQEVRIGETSQVNIFGNIQISTQAIQALCENEVPIAYFSMGSWFYGVTHGLGVKNAYLRRDQFRLADDADFRLRLARSLVSGKIRNQRTMLQRNHVEPPSRPIALLKCFVEDANRADSVDQLLGIEGNAARIYFENLTGMIKVDEPEADRESNGARDFTFDFEKRNRRPPRDPVNALLSLAYSVLAKDLTIICHTVGLDPFLGFYHRPRHGRAPLALDLMEPFRPLIADSAVLSAINTRMVTASDFVRTGEAVSLRQDGRKAFFRAYEQRMDTLVTHPLFGYRVNYRRILEIQARLLARLLSGEIENYPVFITR